MQLAQIKGQQKAVRDLKRYAQSDKIPHAFLFYGIPGIGKSSTATAFAAFLNCKNSDFECSDCPSCKKTYKKIHPDILLVDLLPDKTSITIDQIRDLILKLKYAPLEGRFKVAIIDRAERLNTHSTNALLKTLEEPPPNSVLFLVTSNIRNILPTIVSRCSLIKFNPLANKIIEEKLIEKGYPERHASLISKAAEGSLGKAIDLLENNYYETRNSIIEKLIKNASNNDLLEISEFISANYKDSLNEVLDIILLIQRDLINIKKGLGNEHLFNPDIAESLHSLSNGYSLNKLFLNSDLIHLTRNFIFHNNANSKLAIDNLIMRLGNGNN